MRRQYVKKFLPDDTGPAGLCVAERLRQRTAGTATINKPLPGGEEVNYYRWWTGPTTFRTNGACSRP